MMQSMTIHRLVVLALALLAGTVSANDAEPLKQPGITLVVEEKEILRTSKFLEQYIVPDVLGYDRTGKPYLKLDPATNPEHKAIIDLLAPGVSFDLPQVRDDIAALLDGLPTACKQSSELVLKLNPIEDIDRWVPNVTDNRRITIVALNNCLEETPRACRYCLCQDGGFDFTLGSLKAVLGDCSKALHELAARGAVMPKPNELGEP